MNRVRQSFGAFIGRFGRYRGSWSASWRSLAVSSRFGAVNKSEDLRNSAFPSEIKVKENSTTETSDSLKDQVINCLLADSKHVRVRINGFQPNKVFGNLSYYGYMALNLHNWPLNLAIQPEINPTSVEEVLALNSSLVFENEYLEEELQTFTKFIEKQKDEIQVLKDKLRRMM